MSPRLRHYVLPTLLLAAGLTGSFLWVQHNAPALLGTSRSPDPLTTATPHRPPTTSPSASDEAPTPLEPSRRWLRAAQRYAPALLRILLGAVLIAATVLGTTRAVARWRRSREGPFTAGLWEARARGRRRGRAEIRLGRDDIAAPYEVSKIFDAIAGAMRPAALRHAAFGAEPISLQIANDPATRTLRFVVTAPQSLMPLLDGRLRATYPDVRLQAIDDQELEIHAMAKATPPLAALAAHARRRPAETSRVEVVRLKKARRWLWALATTKDYEHSTIESLITVMHRSATPCLIDLHLTPAPGWLERSSRHAVRNHEAQLRRQGGLSDSEPGVESVVAQKHLKGALEGVGRALFRFDLRILVPRHHHDLAAHLAGVLQETRADNHLTAHTMRLRRRLYAWRIPRAIGPLLSPRWSGVLSSAEIASLWHLPTLRVKGVPLNRTPARELAAGPLISRQAGDAILRDDDGTLGIRPADRRYGWMLLGAAGAGKTAALARHVANTARDRDRALIVVDPKEDFARLCLSLVPEDRDVFYLDLGHPRYGLNVLAAGQLAPELRADILISAIRELSGEQAVGPRSDLFLRAAITAVCTVEPSPSLEHVSAMLDPFSPGYRHWVVRELAHHHEVDFIRDYWQRVFPNTVKASARFVAEAVAAPQNKLARFLSVPALSLLGTHPIQLDLEQIIARRQVLIVNASKGAIGEDNAILFSSLLVLLIQKLLHQQQRKDTAARAQAALVIDEAHNVFTPSFATMLSEGRSGGIEVAAAFQYTGQIDDERVKAGIKSLLQNITIFRLREFDDARTAAALAMEIYSDSINADTQHQRRLRIDPIDIINQPNHRAVNLWLSNGVPQTAFTAATMPMEPLLDEPDARRALDHHQRAQLINGQHPHDDGRHSSPPLIWDIATPVITCERDINVDLAAWPNGPEPHNVRRVAVVVRTGPGREPQGYVAHAAAGSDSRRWLARVADRPERPGWLPAGHYDIEILAWTTKDAEPLSWTPETTDAHGVRHRASIHLAGTQQSPETFRG